MINASAFTISEFKPDRTEKVKRSTAILLEETIEELEQKRKAIEDTNNALQKSLQELKICEPGRDRSRPVPTATNRKLFRHFVDKMSIPRMFTIMQPLSF